MIGPHSHVHPCSVFVWFWLSDGGCALPHRGYYPLLMSAGLHLGGQRDSDMSTWWEAADGWTPTSLSRWVSVSLVYVISYLVFLCLHYGLLMPGSCNVWPAAVKCTHLQHSIAIILRWFLHTWSLKIRLLNWLALHFLPILQCQEWSTWKSFCVVHQEQMLSPWPPLVAIRILTKLLLPFRYTQLPWSLLSRGLKLTRILSFRNRAAVFIGFMITAWQIPDADSACIHKGS